MTAPIQTGYYDEENLCDKCRYSTLPGIVKVPVPYGDGIAFDTVKQVYCTHLMGKVTVRCECKDFDRKIPVDKNIPIDEIDVTKDDCDIPMEVCPFCGNMPEIIYLDEERCERPHGPDDDTSQIGVICKGCDVIMVGDYYASVDKKNIIERWNKRSKV